MSDRHDGRVSDHPDAALLLYAVGEASPDQHAVVTEHLGHCAECRASLHELRETCLELDALPLTSMSQLQCERALRAATSPRFSRSIDRRTRRFSLPVFAGLSAAAVLVAAVLVLAASSARQRRETERLRAEVRETRALAVVALLREPESSERLRGVALGGPLLAHDTRIAAAFVTALRTDPSPNVRLAVLDAVDGAPRHAQLAAEILGALPAEPQPAVRLVMIGLAAEFGGAGARDALRAVASGDPDPSVRARARAAVYRLSPRSPSARE